MNTQKHCWGQGVGFYIVASFFCILTVSPAALFAGSIVGWGYNYYGECNVPAGNNFIAIAAGAEHSLALKSDGNIVGWGYNYYGQATPPAGNNFTAVAAGYYHSLALKSDGNIVGWGDNTYGQLNNIPAGNNFIAVAAGGYHSLALKSDHSIVGWGYNYYGQATPPAGNSFIAIAAGGYHSLALKSDGNIVGWGYNGYGECNVPWPNSGFITIAAGLEYSLALKSDHSIVGWGRNYEGECNVPAENNFIAIAAEWYHSLALKSDRSIVGWGSNDYGQATPPAGNDFLAIAAGGYHSLALCVPVIYVDANATGLNNGSSWANAYKYLQDALTAAGSSADIWVAQGTYKPDRDTNHPGGTGSRTATFQLKNSVAIYGGYPNGGGSRDPNLHQTILSGDIGVLTDVNDNSYHVVTGSNTDSTAILDGFTITAGNNTIGGPPTRRGAGMNNLNGSPTINNCIFSGNTAGSFGGGGMCNYQSSSPIVTNCTFSGNSSLAGGGGMCNVSNSRPIVTNCTFSGNNANNGGGIANSSCSPTLNNCTFSGNSAIYGGGGMENGFSSPTLTGCNFSGNAAGIMGGGGMYNYNSSLMLTGCNFSGNSALQYNGGGIDNESSTLTMSDCNFSNNDANFGGGLYSSVGSIVYVSAGASNSTTDEFYFDQNSLLQGSGSIDVKLGGQMIVDSNAVVEMNDPCVPNTTGTIQCDGLLDIKGNAKLRNTKLNITRQADGLFGKFKVEGSSQVTDVNIYADGDRFIDVDPCTFTGIISNNRIYVTITEGQNNTSEGIMEVRGRDLNEPNCFDNPNVLACQLDSNNMPPFDTNSWTLERLELVAGAKATLVDRFSSGNGIPEVLYVKNLILDNNCALNVDLERLYYTNLFGDPNSLKRRTFLGTLLSNINCDSNEALQRLVSSNNYINPTDPNSNRIYVERVAGLQPDPNGMMKMQNLQDPCNGQMVSARAKAEFAPVVEDKIRIRFNYLFTSTDPQTQIVVYLSDVNELLEPNDPYRAYHYIEVARVAAPPPPRPGSAGSDQFGIFNMLVSTGWLDLSKGTWIELELIEPAQSLHYKSGIYKLMKTTDAGNGATAYADNLSAGISCDNPCQCLDLSGDCGVDSDDFLMVIGEIGSSDPPACVDVGFSSDNYLDSYDVPTWDWAMDITNRLNLCGRQMPLAVGTAVSGGYGYFDGFFNPLNLSNLSDLLIFGKRGTANAQTKLEDRFYVFDSNYHYIRSLEPLPENRYNIRIVRDVNNVLYQINSELGVLLLETGAQIVCPGEVNYANEPRYIRPAKVYVGIQQRWTGGEPDFFGRPILDAAFDSGYIYIVPVVVEPNGNEPNTYAAAAKLALDYNSTPPLYHVVRLYDGPLLPFDYNYPQSQLQYRNNLREIGLDNAGGVYVTNANRMNADILWKFEPNGTVHRLDLDNPNQPCYMPAPAGMYVSNATNLLYLASSICFGADANSSIIRGYSADTLTPVRTITVSKMQHVTSIAEDPLAHSLWIAGFNFNSMPDPPNSYALPFYDPYLAWVPLGVNNVSARCILDANDPSHDLALPLSILWTGAQPQQVKCGGADINGSGTVSLSDFIWLARYWQIKCANSDNYSNCEKADLKPDGYIDLKDLELFAQHWLDSGCN